MTGVRAYERRPDLAEQSPPLAYAENGWDRCVQYTSSNSTRRQYGRSGESRFRPRD